MNNKQLLEEVRKDACSCDVMLGWSCHFCKYTLPELRKALDKVNTPTHRVGNAYKPQKLPRPRAIPSPDNGPDTPYKPKRLPNVRYG